MIALNKNMRDKANFYVGAKLTGKESDAHFITITYVDEHGVGWKTVEGKAYVDTNHQIEIGSWDGCKFLADFSMYIYAI